MSRRGRRRVLDAEERALWAHVVRSVSPLRPRPSVTEAETVAASAAETSIPPEAPEKPVPASKARLSGKVPPAAAVPPPAPPLAPMEPKTRRRLVRGSAPDARLDLHGLTQAAAHSRLRHFLAEAQRAGFSLVLVITGKGEPARLSAPHRDPLAEGRGVLRRAVPHWLAEPAMRTYVVGFEEAGRRHGGEGALYVRIRRVRPKEGDR